MQQAENLLDYRNVIDYWRGYDPDVGKVLSVMDMVEAWVMDDEFPEQIERLGVGLSRFDGSDQDISLPTLQRRLPPDLFLLVMDGLCSSRSLRIFKWLEETLGEDYIDILFGLSEKKEGSILLHRIEVLERERMLSRIFSAERLLFVSEHTRHIRMKNLSAALNGGGGTGRGQWKKPGDSDNVDEA